MPRWKDGIKNAFKGSSVVPSFEPGTEDNVPGNFMIPAAETHSGSGDDASQERLARTHEMSVSTSGGIEDENPAHFPDIRESRARMDAQGAQDPESVLTQVTADTGEYEVPSYASLSNMARSLASHDQQDDLGDSDLRTDFDASSNVQIPQPLSDVDCESHESRQQDINVLLSDKNLITSPPSNSHRPLPPVPFKQIVYQQFCQENEANPWTGNKGDKDLVDMVAKRAISLADEKRKLMKDEATGGDMAAARTIYDLNLAITAKSNELRKSESIRAQDQKSLEQKESQLTGLSMRIRNLESQLSTSGKDLEKSKARAEKGEREYSVLETAWKTEADRISTLKSELKKRGKELHSAKEEVQNAKATNERVKQESIKAHNELVRNHKANVERLESSLKEDYEKKQKKLKKNYEESNQNFQQSQRIIKTLGTDHATRIQSLQTENASRLTQLQTKHDSERERFQEEWRNNVKRIEANHTTNIARLEKNHAEAVRGANQAHTQSLSDLRNSSAAAMQEVIHKQEETSKQMKLEHRAELSRQSLGYKDEIEKLGLEVEEVTRQMEKELVDASERLAREKGELIVEYDEKMSCLLQEKQDAEKKMTEAHDRAIVNLKQQVTALEEQFDVKKDELVASHQAMVEQLMDEHKLEKKHLQRQIQELNAALLNRDEDEFRGSVFKSSGLPRKPDEKLRETFAEIRHMIENLARLSWKSEQTLWTEELIEKSRGKTVARVFRKAVLQDMIWCLVFHAIFGSPFRIFGEEGTSLDEQWFRDCKQDHPVASEVPPWPLVGAHAERWRYMTMRECRETLTKPASPHDARTRVRQGFTSSIDDLSATLKKELGDIVELSGEHQQQVDRLSKKTAATWLDYEMHRCRIVVRLLGNDLTSATEKIDRLRTKSLVLNLSPRLGRYGTVKGTELERLVTIDGCEGEVLEIF